MCQPRDQSTCYEKMFKICNAKLNVTQRTKIIRDKDIYLTCPFYTPQGRNNDSVARRSIRGIFYLLIYIYIFFFFGGGGERGGGMI